MGNRNFDIETEINLLFILLLLYKTLCFACFFIQ